MGKRKTIPPAVKFTVMEKGFKQQSDFHSLFLSLEKFHPQIKIQLCELHTVNFAHEKKFSYTCLLIS